VTTDCEQCSRPLPDQAYVCSTCAGLLRVDLLRIVDLAGEVETAIVKLTRYGSGGRSGERPVPFDEKAVERAAMVGNTVATWARHVAESRGRRLPEWTRVQGPLCRLGMALPLLDRSRPSCAHGSCADIRRRGRAIGVALAADWLVEQVEWLRHQPEAAEAFGELRDASRDLQRLVDRPVSRWYAGPCWEPIGGVDEDGEQLRCQTVLTAAPGATKVRCRECGTEYDAKARKQWLLDEARGALVHAELMARALTALGIEDVTAARVRGMARHGRLMAKGSNAAGDPTYRVGDVLDVIEEQEAAERARVARREAKAQRRADRTAGAA